MTDNEAPLPDQRPPRTPFVQLTRDQAERYLDQFVAEQATAVDLLRDRLAVTDGPADRLDRSLASLEPLWTWAVERVGYRESYTPPSRPGDPPVTPPATWADLDEDALPSWARHTNPGKLGRFTDETWTTIDLVGRYVLEVLRSEVEDVQLTTGDDPHSGYDLQHRPVLRDRYGQTEVDPFEPGLVLVGRSLWGDDPRAKAARRPEALRDSVAIRVGWLQTATG